MKVIVVLLGAVVTLLLAPFPAAGLVHRDAPAPPELADKLGEARSILVRQLERRWWHARFIGAETLANRRTLLWFELRGYPFWGESVPAYMIGGCGRLAQIDPERLSSGIALSGDFAIDPEVQYLGSNAQPPCPGAP